MSTAPAFLAPPFVPSPRAPRPPTRICATAAGPSDPAANDAFDQYEQYEARNKGALAREFSLAQALPARQRHHQFFLQNQAEGSFRNAAGRYIDTLRSSASPLPSRLWVLRSAADPTFGTLHGEPHPPRAVILEPVSDESGVARWVSALNRAGPAFSPMESHFVDWGVVGEFGTEPTILRVGDVVATELLNADWTNARSIPLMKENLFLHAQDVVERGNARVFEVFQSVDEPTCFKTIEVYTSIESLQEHMLTLDPPFASNMMECRAAVNRVRQLHTRMFSLHE